MLIGLHGKKQSGKDTAHGFIKEWADERKQACRREAFADPLKVSAAKALGFKGDTERLVDVCNQLKEPGYQVIVKDPYGIWTRVTGREYLQLYGTEAHREVFGDSFWVDATLPDQYDYTGAAIFVVTDVRFPNEAERVHALGGEVWHIIRSGQAESDEHASEKPLPVEMVNCTISNSAGLDHFRDLVLSRLERVVYA